MSKIRKPEENENGASGIQIAKLDHDFQPNAFSAHTHGDELEIVYLRQGVVSMEVDGIRFDARSGAVVVIPANALHSGTTPSRTAAANLTVTPSSSGTSRSPAFLPDACWRMDTALWCSWTRPIS